MNIAFVGLGNMGAGMVTNLLKNKHTVFCFDIDEKKVSESVNIGAIKIDTLNKLSTSIPLVILCLPHPDISKETIDQLVNTHVETIIETSTLTPEQSVSFNKNLIDKGKHYLSAPMLGGKIHAKKGNIHFLVEGQESVYDTFRDVFLHMGSRVDYMGAPPKATLTKLAYNIARYGNIALGVTIARFIRNYEEDTESIISILKEGAGDSFGQVWQEDLSEMLLSGKPYKPSHIPEKDLSFIKTLVKNESEEIIIDAISGVYKTLSK
jgi:3-hydroxyisobutyrate dehydrogenase